MSKQVEFEKVMDFGLAVTQLRGEFPEFAREINKMHFDVGKKYILCCGHAKCDCQMTFEDFHAGRNRSFATQSEVQSYEFN